MTTALTHLPTTKDHAWAEASGRCFFAWRMAAACQDALREVSQALQRQNDPERAEALLELLDGVQDEIVEHLPSPYSTHRLYRTLRLRISLTSAIA